MSQEKTPEMIRKKADAEEKKGHGTKINTRPGIANIFRLEEDVDRLLIDLQVTLGRPKVRIVEAAIREYAKKFDLRSAPEGFYTTKPRNKK